MSSPDFLKNPIYILKIFDGKNILIHKGFINSKAWSKTIETNEIWEYIPDNGRVISKDFYPVLPDLNKTEIGNDSIFLFLTQKKLNSSNKENRNNLLILQELEKIISQRKKRNAVQFLYDKSF